MVISVTKPAIGMGADTGPVRNACRRMSRQPGLKASLLSESE